MRHEAKSSFFIGDLAELNRRRTHPGARGAVRRFSAASVIDQAISEYHSQLAGALRLGETAQSVRSEEGLGSASEMILDLSLGEDTYYIGRYYEALALNRQGTTAFPAANKILTDVADHGLHLFRAKARVALATNLVITGDADGAVALYAEATQIASRSENGGLHPIFLAAFQCVLCKYNRGDYLGALADIKRIEPLALQIGKVLPALLHVYLNTVAVVLLSNGQPEEAARFCQLSSPFHAVYPEFKRTEQDLVLALRKPSGLIIQGGSAADANVKARLADDDLGLLSLSASLPLPVEIPPVQSSDRSEELSADERSSGPNSAMAPRPDSESVEILRPISGRAPAAALTDAVARAHRPEVSARTLFTSANWKRRSRPERSLVSFVLTRPFIFGTTEYGGRLGVGGRNRYLARPLRWSYVQCHPAYPRPPTTY